MKQKPQTLMINGGSTFKTLKDYLDFLESLKISLGKKIKWQNEYLDKKLGKEFEIIRSEIPSKLDVKYKDWKVWFEKHLSLLGKNYILIENWKKRGFNTTILLELLVLLLAK